jgi:hypothetical protein
MYDDICISDSRLHTPLFVCVYACPSQQDIAQRAPQRPPRTSYPALTAFVLVLNLTRMAAYKLTAYQNSGARVAEGHLLDPK